LYLQRIATPFSPDIHRAFVLAKALK